MKKIIFICVLVFKHETAKHFQRVLIRDDRQEMKECIRSNEIARDNLHVECIAEYDFKQKITKYYAVNAFMNS